MKNKLILCICFSLLFSPVLAFIEDDFVLQTLDKNLQIKKQEKKFIKAEKLGICDGDRIYYKDGEVL